MSNTSEKRKVEILIVLALAVVTVEVQCDDAVKGYLSGPFLYVELFDSIFNETCRLQ